MTRLFYYTNNKQRTKYFNKEVPTVSWLCLSTIATLHIKPTTTPLRTTIFEHHHVPTSKWSSSEYHFDLSRIFLRFLFNRRIRFFFHLSLMVKWREGSELVMCLFVV